MSFDHRGSGLVLSMVVLTGLSLMALAIYHMARAIVRESVYEVRLIEAQSIAEAGLEHALSRLSRDPSWREGFSDKLFAGGSYTVTFSPDSPPWITSTGRSRPIFALGSASRMVRARLRKSSGRTGWEPGTWSIDLSPASKTAP
ncbi:MAG: pilus assembly PilX N-terminal domain-containing protein [Elusimicrobia bacterium]|nr:pilus assembly PilX N-terminal domain-containing protein [Elusimicrobiota bacterium]